MAGSIKLTSVSGRWVVSFFILKTNGCNKYKVTRAMPRLSVSETKVFDKKEEARAQFDKWHAQ